MNDKKRFTMKDEGFVCLKCGRQVLPLGYTARDHCPFCLYSRHVDIFPGDRQNSCQGLLKPIDIEKYRDTYKIIYQCEKCAEIHKNVMASDDDMNQIIALSQKEK